MTVLFFATARDATGEARLALEGAAGTSLGQVVERLGREFGAQLTAVLPFCAIWVNGRPSDMSTVLSAGDEVAVLPPVSGG